MLIETSQYQLARIITGEKEHLDEDKSFLDESIKNGVTALISKHSLKATQTKFSSTFERLEQFEKQLKIIHLLQHNSFKAVFQKLKAADINFIVLKGWALSHTIYESPHQRPKTDIDILIDEKQKAEVLSIFKSLGFDNPRGWEPSVIIDQVSMRKELVNGVFANVDIHFKLTNDRILQPLFCWEDLYQSAQLSSTLGARVISKPYALLHAIVHLLHHATHGDFLKLVWFYDIHLLVSKFEEGEQQQFINIVAKSGLGEAVNFALKQTDALFPSTQLSDLISNVSLVKANKKYAYLTQPPSLLKATIRNFTATKGLAKKMMIVKETLFPPRAEIYLKYGHSTKWPLPLLYLRRIIGGFKRFLKK